jgi:hypothetical protein
MKKLKEEHTTKELIELAKKATERAWNENFAMNLPIIIEENGEIVKKYKDGRTVIIKTKKVKNHTIKKRRLK